MFAQQLTSFGIEQADVQRVPLHLHHSSDPAWRRAVVGRLDFDAAIEMHDALTVLVIAERFDRQGKQEWFLFSKHRSDLPFGCAVDARVCPPFFPVVEISLGLFQAFEAQAFEWCSLGMTNTCL